MNEITYYEKVSSIGGPNPGNPRRPSQLVLPAAHRKVALWGYHDEVGHLGLEHMLVLMYDQFFWPSMADQAGKHIDKCHPCLTFTAKHPNASLEKIVATHPLELVHLDCVWSLGKV